MNYLDIILVIPLLWGLYKGVSKGIIKELASLMALIIGIYGAVHFADSIQPYIKNSLSIESSFLPILSFAITFIGIVLVVRVIGFIVDKIIKLVALGFISRVLGGVFGVLKTAFIISALLLIVNTFDYYLNLIPLEQKNASVLYRPLSNMIPSIAPNVSDGNSLINEAEKIWEEAEQKINPQE
ncbi:CvpA family protein [Flavobacteriales bacterium]|nr:CvpA family protein [Flavobacteriales bacterium]